MAAPETAAVAPPAPPGHRRHPALLVVLLLVTAVTVWHAFEASQHLLTDRDPGVYNTTARWLAREGTLLVEPAIGPFADQPGLTFEEQGWNLDDDGRLEPQFLHLLPVVLAGAQVVGGDRLLLVAPAAIAGGALLAVFAFATRVVRPWWALLSTAGLASSLPWVHLSRDAFSEPLAVLLLFAGLSVLFDATVGGSWRRALVAGLLLGGVSMARVEGFVALLPLVASCLVVLARAQRRDLAGRRSVVGQVGALVVGAALTTSVAVADLVLFGTWYLDDLGGLLELVAAGLVLVVVLGTAAVVVASRRARRRPDEAAALGDRHVEAWGWVAAGGVLAVAGAAWFVRPLVSTVTGAPSAAIAALEAQEGRVAEGVRRYSEHSVQWLGWYLGPLVLALGFAGLALVVRRLVVGRPQDVALLPFAAVFVVVSALYLWRPSIVPDHVWAMRRYAIVTLPGLLLLAVLVGQEVGDRARGAGRAGLAVVVGLSMTGVVLGVPLATVAPVAGMTTQVGLLEEVHDVCDAVGPDGAVVVVPGAALELVTAQTVRSFCGVPAAIAAPGLQTAQVGELAAAWAGEGRRLHLLGADAAQVSSLAGRQPELVAVVPNDQQLEATLTERPDELVSVPVTFVVADAAPGG